MAQAIEEQEQTIDPETGELREPEEPELDPELLAPYEDQITTRDVTPEDFGRIAAQTAKQVILQRIREAERHMMFEEYQDRVGELITGIIQQSDNRYTLVQLRERVEALLPRSEQVWNERYDHGMRVKAVITEVNARGQGPGDRRLAAQSELIKQLFELEVPEIADSLVEIVGVAREPGYRSKIAVISHADGVDPVGACVGPAGLAGADGGIRAARREDRHHPLQRGAGPFRGQGAVPGPRARGAGGRREAGGDGDRAGRPALAGDRARGPERAPCREAHRLEGGHQVRDRVQPGGGGADLRGGRGGRRPLRRGALRRPAMPERRAAGVALLRPSAAPGAGALRAPIRSTVLTPLTDEEIKKLADSAARRGRDHAAGGARHGGVRPGRRPRRTRPRKLEPRTAEEERGGRGGRGGGGGRRRPSSRGGGRGGGGRAAEEEEAEAERRRDEGPEDASPLRRRQPRKRAVGAESSEESEAEAE